MKVPEIGQEVTINSNGDLYFEVEARPFIGKACIVVENSSDDDCIVRLKDDPAKMYSFRLRNIDWDGKDKQDGRVVPKSFVMVHHRAYQGGQSTNKFGLLHVKEHRGYFGMPKPKHGLIAKMTVHESSATSADQTSGLFNKILTELEDRNVVIGDTVMLKTDPVGTVKPIYSDDDVDIRGVPRSHYWQLARDKEKKLVILPLYSMGFYRQELFSSVEWVGSFSGKKVDIDLEIDRLAKAGIKIVETETVDDQFRIWFTL